MKTFTDRLVEKIKRKRSVLCVGLDPQIKLIPTHILEWAKRMYGDTFKAVGAAFKRFNAETIEVIATHAVAVKPQIAFYECYGSWGLEALESTIKFASHFDLEIITDAKRGDGGDTADAYADGFIGEVPMIGGKTAKSPISVDCLTIHGYIGSACVLPFVKRVKKFGTGAFVVDKTSFSPNSEVEQLALKNDIPVWQALARMVNIWGEETEGGYGYRNLGVVMGATYPKDASIMREILPAGWFLVPGYGEQGGGADGAVVGFDEYGFGAVVNSSRGIIGAWRRKAGFPSMYLSATTQAAESAKDDLNSALYRAGKLKW